MPILSEQTRPICKICNTHPCEGNGISKLGYTKWRSDCTRCKKIKYNLVPEYKKHKKQHCESCGFVAKHAVQLDVDHINGDHKDNSVSNLQTLCANCHRLKTHLNKEHTQRKSRIL
jgi:5-methylcytosine-specific restriction endonuclease McrA